MARTADLLGDRWTPLVLREVLLGCTRFGELQDRLGVNRSVLTQRLRRLEDEGIVVRHRYMQHPPRDEYQPTDKGRALWDVLSVMWQYGKEWLYDEPLPVLLGAAWLVWRRRSQLRALPLPGQGMGTETGLAAALFAGAAGIHAWATLTSAPFLLVPSLMLALFGWAALRAGRAGCRAIAARRFRVRRSPFASAPGAACGRRSAA